MRAGTEIKKLMNELFTGQGLLSPAEIEERLKKVRRFEAKLAHRGLLMEKAELDGSMTRRRNRVRREN